MKKVLSLVLLITLCCANSLPAQGLFSLFGGSDAKKAIRVKFVDGDESAKDEILLIKIKGVIQEADSEEGMPFKIEKDLFENLRKDLEVVRKRKAVKAILLEINSPGGEVTASDIVYQQLKKIQRETKKPVVAIIGTMGASGAYYVACAAGRIVAHPTSIIGSIGVLMQAMNLEELAKKVGLKAVTLKSEKTPMKDVLSPFKEITPEEREMLMTIINSIYDRFIDIVSESRKLRREEVIKIADGGIFTAARAKELGLIDAIGYREDAIAEACEMAKIDNAALVKRVTQKGISEIISEMSSMSSGVPALRSEIRNLLLNGITPVLLFK
ncbi:MAG: signal peptide peptidase SppA [Candidatus Riflebacteria bacterium HGW-Riflebacteria-1]|jgi:protease-4|nr:MAG: signal peptide peptidase SppA [Candidatus Riflebacteria bacterium HGW-Riflebacteria-1]